MIASYKVSDGNYFNLNVSRTQASDVQISRTKGRIWESMKFALKETCREGRLWETALKTTLMIGAIGVSSMVAWMAWKEVQRLGSLVGKWVVIETSQIYGGREFVIHTSESFVYDRFHFCLAACDKIGAAIIVSFTVCVLPVMWMLEEDPCMTNFRKAYR